VSTPWDAHTYDRASGPQQGWASQVLERLAARIAPDATVLDIGCGTGRVTEALLGLVPAGRVLAVDASEEMVDLARERLGVRVRVWRQDVLELTVEEPVDAVVSTATLHWVPDHDRMWKRIARALRPGGVLEAQCGGEGNIARVREVIDAVVADGFPELAGWSPWVFAGPGETEARLARAGFEDIRCWLHDEPTRPDDVAGFVRSSILPAHLARLAPERREPFASAVLERVGEPLDYVRLNVSATRAWPPLTPRQREIAQLAGEGLTNAEIAGRLGVAPATVKKHLEHVYAAVGVLDRAALARLVGPPGER
jgi:trans-aconitate 2-methyltransferase